ncbi:MAG: hypothetical protein RIQ47_1038 [Bacteroidota bacterium]|jgi:DNA-binding NtrC family response regulator
MNSIFAEQLKLKGLEEISQSSQIVIVDDDPSFSIMLKDYLISACDFNAELFSNGEQFLSEYQKDDRRIIILDYDFGKNSSLNGLSILKAVKLKNPYATVIMVSGQDDVETAIETIRNGASDYFLKSNKTVFTNVVNAIVKVLELERLKLN